MSRRIAIVCGLTLLLGAWAAAPAAADPGRGATILCYIWANAGSSVIGVPYVPSPTYSYNAVGRATANLVTRTAVGTYTVTCKGVGGGNLFASPADSSVVAEGVSTNKVARDGEAAEELKANPWGPGGHVQVTAYGGDSDYCKVVGWVTGGADFSVTVRCFNHAGGLSDNQFDLLFVW
jgi:hypothetical protein